MLLPSFKLHCSCSFLFPMFLRLKLFHGGGKKSKYKRRTTSAFYANTWWLMPFRFSRPVSIWTEKVTLPAKLFVRIPAGTYPGQRETARSFRSVSKLLLRHHYFLWQIGPIFLYQTVSAVILSIRANVNDQTKQYKSNIRIATTMKWIQIAKSLTWHSELSSEKK